MTRTRVRLYTGVCPWEGSFHNSQRNSIRERVVLRVEDATVFLAVGRDSLSGAGPLPASTAHAMLLRDGPDLRRDDGRRPPGLSDCAR